MSGIHAPSQQLRPGEKLQVEEKLPPEYRPYSKILLCSNTLENVTFIFEIDGQHPLLIGQSEVPEVWIKAPLDNTRKQWGYIVNKNVALHPDIHVEIDAEQLTVKAGRTSVLVVSATDSDSVVVTQLDFRPFGINIFGNANSLSVGSQTLKDNRFSGGRAAIAIR